MNQGQISYLPGFEPDVDKWTSDDWESPALIAQQMGELIQEDELDILEPAAGTGQILRFIPRHIKRIPVAVEIKPSRVKTGKERCHVAHWINANFLQDELGNGCLFDLIITNPPFSLRMEFIARSLSLLKPSGRLLFLMPIDFNCGKAMGNQWKRLDCHIHHQYVVQNRIAYLNAKGQPQPGRQVYDAVFDIRLGKSDKVSSFLGEKDER